METAWTATMTRCGIAPANVSAVNSALGIDGVETFRWYDRKRLTETIKDIRRLQGDDKIMSIEVERNLRALCAWIEHQTAIGQAVALAEFDSNTKNVWLDHVDFTDRITDELTGYCEGVVLPELEVPSQWRSQGRPVYYRCNVPLRSVFRHTLQYPVKRRYTESADDGQDGFTNNAYGCKPSPKFEYSRRCRW
jgi:hypothetical protein